MLWGALKSRMWWGSLLSPSAQLAADKKVDTFLGMPLFLQFQSSYCLQNTDKVKIFGDIICTSQDVHPSVDLQREALQRAGGYQTSVCISETVLSSQIVWPGVLGSMFGSDFSVTSHKSFNHCTCLFCINRIHLYCGIYPARRTHGKKVFILRILKSATHRPSCLIFSPIISYRQLQTIFHPLSGFSSGLG